MINIIIYLLKPENRLRQYYEKRRRAKQIKINKEKIPDYLKHNDFCQELNFKLWTTKGARFKASERCEEMNRRSTRAIGWISAYLIIFNVLCLCNIPYFTVSTNINNFISIALSIMILVFSQFEYAMNYSVKAKDFHSCALEISALYDKLRYTKTYKKEDEKENSTFSQIEIIYEEYEQILKKYPNHQHIDYEFFQTDKKYYFRLSYLKIVWIKFKYCWKVRCLYWICVYGLPLLYVVACIMKNNYLIK